MRVIIGSDDKRRELEFVFTDDAGALAKVKIEDDVVTYVDLEELVRLGVIAAETLRLREVV